MRPSFASLFAVAGVASALEPLDSLTITNLLSSLSVAPADDPRFTNWTAPGPNDLRSPCPGLNTAANHGFIHHDGRDMTIPHLLEGLAASMNIGADFTILIGAVGLLSSANPLGGSFTLSDLDQHNFPIEHDASISRADAYFGNDYSFNNRSYDQYFDSFGDATTSSLKSIANAKSIRRNDSLNNNPTFTYSFREFILSYGENGLWVQTLSDPFSGVAKLDYAHMFFTEEKFPYELGWRPSTLPINLPSLGQMLFELFTMEPDPLVEGANVVADSYKDLLEVLVGGSEALNNITQGLSQAVGL